MYYLAFSPQTFALQLLLMSLPDLNSQHITLRLHQMLFSRLKEYKTLGKPHSVGNEAWHLSSGCPRYGSQDGSQKVLVEKSGCYLLRMAYAKQPPWRRQYFRGLQHMDIYIYIYIVNSKLGPKWPFWGSKLGPNVLVSIFPFCFCFFSEMLLFCRELELLKTWKKKINITMFWVETWSNYVAQHTLDQVLTQPWTKFLTQPFWHFWAFFPFKINWNHYFMAFSAKICISKPTPKIGTLVVNTIALIEKEIVRSFLSACLLSCIFAVSGFLGRFFWEEWIRQNSNQNNQKGKKTTRCKQQKTHRPVFKKEKADNTDTKYLKLVV